MGYSKSSYMNEITLNFLVFHDERNEFIYCYCLETFSQNLFRTSDRNEAIASCLKQVEWELQHRFHYGNLSNRGWKINRDDKTFEVPQIEVQKAILRHFEFLRYPSDYKNYDYFSSKIIVPDAVYEDSR